MPKSAAEGNLLIVTPYFYPHQGGVEKHVLKTSLLLKPLLKKQGLNLEIITQRPNAKLPHQEKTQGLMIHRFDFPKIKFFGLLIIWSRILFNYFQLIKKADVIHVHDVMIWLLPVRLLFPRKKIILTMHGWEGIYPIPRKNIWLKQLSAVLANKVICVGGYISKHYGVNCDELIDAGVDLQNKLSAEKVRQKLEVASNKRLKIVYLGRLARDTGLELMLQAWQELPKKAQEKLEIVFVGDGPLRRSCEMAGKVLGWVHEEQVESELRSAQICFAGGYLSALEAMAAGCRVFVGADNQLKYDYWQDWGENGRVLVFTSAEEIKLFLLKPQPILNTAQVMQNKKWAEKQTWDKIADLYWDLYRGLYF